MEFNPFNPSVTHDFPSNSIPMTDQPDARTQRHATNSDQATTNSDQATQSPQEHKSTMQKIKEIIPGTKAHKAKKAQKAGAQDETGMPQDEVDQPVEGNQMASGMASSDPEARERMASPMMGGTPSMASSMMGGTPSMGDSMDDSLGDSRAFFQYVQQQWQRMEVLSNEADLSKNDTSMGTSSMSTSPMMSPSLEKDPLTEQNVYAGNTAHPIGMDDQHLTYGSTVDTRGPGLQHGPLGGTHAQTGTLHRASEALPTDKESRKADYTGTDTGSGLETRRGVEQV